MRNVLDRSTKGAGYLEALLIRRFSCRAFRSDLLPDELVEQLFALAQRAPSWCNTQPWQVHALSGAATARFGEALTRHALGDEQVADLGLPAYRGVYAERRRKSGHGLYATLDIDRSDRAARRVQALKNFTFFGAPYTAIITTDRALGNYGVLDCGGYINTLMLAAQALGLGVIAQGAVAMHSALIHRSVFRER